MSRTYTHRKPVYQSHEDDISYDTSSTLHSSFLPQPAQLNSQRQSNSHVSSPSTHRQTRASQAEHPANYRGISVSAQHPGQEVRQSRFFSADLHQLPQDAYRNRQSIPDIQRMRFHNAGTKASFPTYQAQIDTYGNQPRADVHIFPPSSLNVGATRKRSLTRPERSRPRPSLVRPMSTRRLSNYSDEVGPDEVITSNAQTMDSEKLDADLNRTHIRETVTSMTHDGIQPAVDLETGRPSYIPARPPLPTQASTPGPRRMLPVASPEEKRRHSIWEIFAIIMTCCFPPFVLKYCCRKMNKQVRQAWREKMTLVYLIAFACACLAFVTFGLHIALCPDSTNVHYPYSQYNGSRLVKTWRTEVLVYGNLYQFSDMQGYIQSKGMNFSVDYWGADLSPLFLNDGAASCNPYGGIGNANGSCRVNDPFGGWIEHPCIPISDLQSSLKSTSVLNFDWIDLVPNDSNGFQNPGLIGYDGKVLNISSYLSSNNLTFGAHADTILRHEKSTDATYLLSAWSDSKDAAACLEAKYTVGYLESETMGCFASQAVLTTTMVFVFGLIIIRFTMAVLFQWLIAHSLVRPGGRSGFLAWRSVMGGNNDPANKRPSNHSMYKTEDELQMYEDILKDTSTESKAALLATQANSVASSADQSNLYALMLVTCYSEGRGSIKTTLDSLAETTYSSRHKLMFIVADGLIKGSGETQTTPDIIVDMLDIPPTMTEPKACSYVAVADGAKQWNMAKVYAGYYKHAKFRVPAIVVVKCGTVQERSIELKPGNRGKRDSQVILMSFLQRVLFNDRLCELDYELFWKMTWLMHGVTPDKFEVVLMVDADTKVMPKSLSYMVAAMVNDITIMGLCGETRIANKRSSWVTMIQVFEYYISHHYSKAFESVFGGVTCLPGCFCMYRIKAPKNGAWVPILANPDILQEYNQNVVNTLHAKNLLLLGEDRFLSTLMLRMYPKRQMMFLPQARCKTVVPDRFSVLVSQRRRWINSTVHNLMELVMVSDLCGIACLSMQFAIMMELLGTLVLPAAICFTMYLIIQVCISNDPQITPLVLLAAILGLPALLIVITTRKLVYIAWMSIYILALPIWNFVLPVYSFWHFDDFTWGSTRTVEGEVRQGDHSMKDGDFDASQITMRKWEEWERERLMEQRRKAAMLASFGKASSRTYSGSTLAVSDTGALAVLGLSSAEDLMAIRNHIANSDSPDSHSTYQTAPDSEMSSFERFPTSNNRQSRVQSTPLFQHVANRGSRGNSSPLRHSDHIDFRSRQVYPAKRHSRF
ncbi:hypothetical protein BZG36_04277 [Bifiguratus adelaidae]|uniref:chitin synthase n=1 Tax=Bifiguratus adelaidae TaxID=1938954 RepID=A0A261XW54_9FUNG|nr:hypothetical protein BZG36_04277 [Bifiguratus adelaidae]